MRSAAAHVAVMLCKHIKARIIGPQAQYEAPSMPDHAPRFVDHLLDHRLDAPALGAVAHRRFVPVQRMQPDQAQQVHGHSGQLADQVIGIELARGQALQSHVGFELRVKLLMRAMVLVQRDDLLGCKGLGAQRGAPALQLVLGQQQRLAVFVNGALHQAVDAPQRMAMGAYACDHAFCGQRLLPQALALALTQALPSHGAVGYLPRSDGLHRGAARVPLDDEGDLTLEHGGLMGDLTHQSARAKARVHAQQQWPLSQTTRQGQHTFKVVLALGCRMLGARAQGQLQAKASGAQVSGQWAVAVYPGIGATHQLFGGAAVVHGKGVDVQGRVAAGQRPKGNGLTLDAGAEQSLVDRRGQIKPSAGMGVHALAQRRARRRNRQRQGTGKEGIAAKVLDGVKVTLALAQQGQVAFEDGAVGDARAHGKARIDQGGQVDVFEILPHQSQARLAAEVVGQFFDNEVGHVAAHLQGELQVRAKSLISMGNPGLFDAKSRIQGRC